MIGTKLALTGVVLILVTLLLAAIEAQEAGEWMKAAMALTALLGLGLAIVGSLVGIWSM